MHLSITFVTQSCSAVLLPGILLIPSNEKRKTRAKDHRYLGSVGQCRPKKYLVNIFSLIFVF